MKGQATKRLNSIQILRAVAAIMVVASHAAGKPTSFPNGACGVDIFFVISGFIIATVAPGRKAGEFLRARLVRIFPLYFAVGLPMIYFNSQRWGFHVAPLLASLTLWPVWGGEFVHPYLGVAWTLSFEMLFYIGATLALFSGRIQLPLAISALSFIGYLVTGSQILGFIGNPIILEFLAGMVLTIVPRNLRIAWPALLVSLLILMMPGGFLDPETATDPARAISRAVAWGYPAISIVYFGLCIEPYVRSPKFAPLVFLGDASYAIYLVHLPLLRWFGFTPLIGLLGVFAGLLLHRFVERPVLSGLRKWSPSAREAEASNDVRSLPPQGQAPTV